MRNCACSLGCHLQLRSIKYLKMWMKELKTGNQISLNLRLAIQTHDLSVSSLLFKYFVGI